MSVYSLTYKYLDSNCNTTGNISNLILKQKKGKIGKIYSYSIQSLEVIGIEHPPLQLTLEDIHTISSLVNIKVELIKDESL